MPSFIPFVNSIGDADILNQRYQDAPICRIPLDTIEKVKSRVQGLSSWIDPAVDGYHQVLGKTCKWKTKWEKLLSGFSNGRKLADPKFVSKPERPRLREFAEDVLDRCAELGAKWLSIPQLPLVSDASRNRVNKLFVEVCQEWRANRKFAGKLVLPVIFTKQDQYRTGRSERVRRIVSAVELGANGVWVVDQSLGDQDGRKTYVHRFRWLVDFHDELSQKLPTGTVRIAGPYWGLNLILWAKGLVDYPAISLGSSYQYRLANYKSKAGGPPLQRVALEPLRRWARAQELEGWLRRVEQRLSRDDPSRQSFANLRGSLRSLVLANRTQRQVADAYRRWLDELEAIPPAGRAVALYQDLSSAVVLGSSLPNLPENGPARAPAVVAKQLMFNCL